MECKYYYLMNKDKYVARFHVNIVYKEVLIDQIFTSLPEWLCDLPQFITNRRAPKKRENIAKLLEVSGCDNIVGYLDITHALSLIDTFWVKPVDSTLQWGDLSLYTHPFNELIAKTAFEGGLHGKGFSTTSPEYGTDGSFAKCWIREDGIIKMLKRGSSGAANAGLEPFSEYYAGQVISHFTTEYVSYDLRTQNSRVCSVCNCFTDENIGFLPYEALDKGNTSVAKVINTMGAYGLADKVKAMFVIDAIIMNEDRHKSNFGFLVDNNTQEILDMAPLFDHNISLLPYAMEDDFKDIKAYMAFKGPRIGEDFISVAKRCLTKETRRILINLKGFKFVRHPKYNLPEWRLKALEQIIQSNIGHILG